ncbi:WYL domain-containing protein [Streptomyces sp. NP160]|uniref:helix-turn-helix transcriptional regulator n=1 Tax=Streptomyces sp. NP160 TaxID=2586637 RepID=UPI00111A7299|nr:WYL domain-containing protein [Streptomyces sp. NP160]TNM68209.1 WYL domain-containing protein [Streptomyces sp. NP160]
MTTTTRLLELLSLLQTRRDWPGPLLASRLGTTDRTVRRDVERLREMGYRITATMGPDGGYRLDAGSELPPLLFDEDQTVAVAVALQTAPALGPGMAEAAVRALGTIRQVMPPRLRQRLDGLRVSAVGRPGEAASVHVSGEVLVTLADAIRAREVLRFDYLTRDGVHQSDDRALPLPRRAEPVHLVASQARWYLLGWDLDREDWRLYSVDRVRPRTPNGPRFTPRSVPSGDVEGFVAARVKGSDVDEWPCRGAVVLDLPAREVLPFAGDGTVTAVGEGRCVLEVGSWSWGALAESFGRFEVPMEVLGPPELLAAFAVVADRYREASRGAATGRPGESAPP